MNDPVTNAVTANYPSLSRIRYTVPDLAPREICSHPPRNRTLMIAVSASGLLFGTGYAMFCGYTAWEGIGHPATAYETQKSFIGVSQGMIIAGISSLFLKFFLDQINECQNDSITSPE
ncbi:MAG: hypothetical protein JXB03_13250 [Spirochaetales bacterium]|nr:hypothetical protein [Spirochaetales bacterium]